jgi:hypothetical protein
VETSIEIRDLEHDELSRVGEIDRTEHIEMLFEQVGSELARRVGDTEIVVTATPSENTVRFYLGRGYQPMAEPFPELLELEPEDIHMSKAL